MKAVAFFPEEQNIRIIEVPELKPISPSQVRVKTLQVGICGTDREIMEKGYGNTPTQSDHLILGHECLGEIVEVGSEVAHFSIGQLVVPRVRRPCDAKTCRACQIGRPDFCQTGEFTERGIMRHHGFMVDEFVDEQQYFHVVPHELRDVGVLIEPLTVAEKAMIQIRDIQGRLPYLDQAKLNNGNLEGAVSVVLGAGPVAILGALTLLNSGSKVYVYSRKAEPNAKAQLVESVGAEYVSSDTVSPDQLLEIAGNIDIIYEATGASDYAFEMTRLLGRNGIYIFTGVPGQMEPIPMDTARIMSDRVLKNQLFVGTVNAGPAAFESAVQTLGEVNRRWPSNVNEIITERIRGDEVENALKSHGKGIKTVVEFT